MSYSSQDQLPSAKKLFESFLLDRTTGSGYSERTVEIYRDRIREFEDWLSGKEITRLDQITSERLREYKRDLETHCNPGGVHLRYRVIKTALRWIWKEHEIPYRNPISVVGPPRLTIKPLPGIELSDIGKLIDACSGTNEKRDRAILAVLLDTGCRAAELCDLDIGDVDETGSINVRKGKGNKERYVFLGANARRYLRAYLRERKSTQEGDPLFVTDEGMRLNYSALRGVVRRRAEGAGVDEPGLHDFRRACALALYQANVDILTISRILGHSTIELLARYIREDEKDLKRKHNGASPADKLR